MPSGIYDPDEALQFLRDTQAIEGEAAEQKSATHPGS